MYGFLSGFSGTSSIMTLAAVAIDRYLVISRPLDIAKKPTRSWAYATIGLIWLYAAIFTSLPLFGFGKYVPEGYLTSCSFDYLSEDAGTRIFILVFCIGAWVCPLAAITFCYTAIVRAVHHVRQNVTCERAVAGEPSSLAGSQPTPCVNTHNSRREQKINIQQHRGIQAIPTLSSYSAPKVSMSPRGLLHSTSKDNKEILKSFPLIYHPIIGGGAPQSSIAKQSNRDQVVSSIGRVLHQIIRTSTSHNIARAGRYQTNNEALRTCRG